MRLKIAARVIEYSSNESEGVAETWDGVRLPFAGSVFYAGRLPRPPRIGEDVRVHVVQHEPLLGVPYGLSLPVTKDRVVKVVPTYGTTGDVETRHIPVMAYVDTESETLSFTLGGMTIRECPSCGVLVVGTVTCSRC